MPTTHLLYLHGFRSSPQSVKAQKMAAIIQPTRVQWACPQLPPSPRAAMTLIRDQLNAWQQAPGFDRMVVIGSSLGGFYATAVAEQQGCRAVLLNPAVNPARDLERYIGEQTSWQNPAECFFFEPGFIDELRQIDPGPLRNPENYLAVIAKGDEVLDWREMTARYAGARLELLEGGDHALSDFDHPLALILDFLQFRRKAALKKGKKGAPDRCLHWVPSAVAPHAPPPARPPKDFVLFVLFEEAGKFLAGRVLLDNDASLQVELDSGKRVKVKASNALLRFEKPAPAVLVAAAQTLSAEIELDLAWEFAGEDEFGFADMARDYFSSDASKPASTEQQAAALFRLFEAPHYFRRAGKGRFKKAPAEILQQALAAIEKKKQVVAQIATWAEALGRGECPAPIREQLYKILFRPDKNSPEYKAVVDASRATQTAPLDLLQKTGAIASPYQFHWKRFLFENFPKGTAFQALQAPAVKDELPLADVRAFSIDDSSTTEIDDALSVQGLVSQGGNGIVTLGIHIAAPGLAVLPGSPIDAVGRARLSTVYMPGYKLTMLPDEIVQTYTLQEGRNCPSLSLYVTIDEQTLAISGSVTRLERVPIASNLRHDVLDSTFNEAFFESARAGQGAAIGDVPWSIELSFLHRFARHLKAQREVVRGKPENFNRPDYNFKLDNVAGQEPRGDERVSISTRQRGAPLDLIVAEAMILANSTWGLWLAEHGVPGVYRSQASLAPGVKVRMGTRALPHAGLGVPAYAWSTSPLRRYTDLVNQWQIIACVRHGRTAALAAPFKPKDADLFSVISSFDAAYSAYNGYQAGIERYWTLKYLQQNEISELTATTFKDNLVRADDLPLVLPALGAQGLPRGARVRVKLGEIDEITLDITGSVIERLDTVQSEDPTTTDDEDENEDGEGDAPAGPISIAVDMHGEIGGLNADGASATATLPG